MMETRDYTKLKWDYLLILDACRYDIFKEIVEEKKLKGKLTEFNTRTPHTPFWYRKYWGHNKNNINLISANPQPFYNGTWYAHRNFKYSKWVDPALKFTKKCLTKWNHPSGIFYPHVLIDFVEKYKKPNERHLIHFIPPHLPYIGPKGLNLLKKLGLKVEGNRHIYDDLQIYGRKNNWKKLRECYKDSLSTTIDIIYERINVFNNKIVISADHSELIGDPKFDNTGKYDHSRVRINKNPEEWKLLCTVPWFEVEK